MASEKNKSNGHGHHEHHIVPDSMIFKIGACLAVLTVITVAVSRVDLGALNFLVAILVATIKGTLVAMFFMGLKYDHKENAAIFATSFLFLAIFIGFTATDIFFRGDVYVKGSTIPEGFVQGGGGGGSKLTKPWVATPELVEKGKGLFAAQCVACHGPAGMGDGPAAAALNPKPRNFHAVEGWKNGRKISGVFKTLKEGLAGSAMSSFESLPMDDRWALTHYVLSLAGSAPESDSAGDFAKIGVDPSKDHMGGGGPKPTLPIEFAIDRVATE